MSLLIINCPSRPAKHCNGHEMKTAHVGTDGKCRELGVPQYDGFCETHSLSEAPEEYKKALSGWLRTGELSSMEKLKKAHNKLTGGN